MQLATYSDHGIVVKFRFDDKKEFYTMVDNVKEIPGRVFHSDSKSWLLPLSPNNIKRLIKWGFKLDGHLQSIITGWQVKGDFEDPLLRDYQNKHAKNLIKALQKNGGAIDGSDTGTGKTYVAIAIAKFLGMRPIVLTPKTVVPVWYKVAKLFKVKDIYTMNYEQYRIGNSSFLSVKGKKKKDKQFKWNATVKDLIIFDEVHRCKDYRTLNAQMLEKAAEQRLSILCLSATVADNPLQMQAVGKAIRLFSNHGQFIRWALSRGVKKGFWTKYEFSEKSKAKFLTKIHEDIYPSRGSRISIKDLGDKFPKNLVIAECYDMGVNTDRIIDLQDGMRGELDKLRARQRDDKENPLTKILRARQEIELLKVPTFVELTQDHLEEGMSVAIFVNFKETLYALQRRLKCNCIIDGDVRDQLRELNRSNFQKDKERIIILNIKAGGEGISLHDIRGQYPRVGLISPNYSAITLIQALGRLPREGAKSNVIQKLVFCANTVEEKVAEKVQKKVENINLINTGDLEGL